MRGVGILLRFIDLGLVLLLGFLAVAEVQPEAQVPLPGGQESDVRHALVYRLVFDETMHAHLIALPQGETYCKTDDVASLNTCMHAAVRDALDKNDQSAPFILAPERGANVEQLVLLLDLCKAEGWSCTIES